MRKFFLTLFFILTLGSAVQAQYTARRIQWYPAAPAHCSPAYGDIYFNTVTGKPYYCSAVDTWSDWTIGTGAVGGSGTGGKLAKFTLGTTIGDSIITESGTVITVAGSIRGVTDFNGLVVTPNTGAITTGSWAATAIPVAKGGTGSAYFTVAGPTQTRTYTFPDANSSIPAIGAANTFTVGPQTIQTGANTNKALILKGAASQSSPLLELQDSAGNIVANVLDPTGGGTTPTAGINLINNTAATGAVSQYGPMYCTQGNAFVNPNSQPVKWCWYVATADNGLSGALTFAYSNNGGALTRAFQISSSTGGIFYAGPLKLSQGSFGTADPVDLTDGASVDTDASAGNVFNLAYTQSFVLNKPTNGSTNLLRYRFKHPNNATVYTIDVSAFVLSSTLSSVTLSTTANKIDVMVVEYEAASEWGGAGCDCYRILAFNPGF